MSYRHACDLSLRTFCALFVLLGVQPGLLRAQVKPDQPVDLVPATAPAPAASQVSPAEAPKAGDLTKEAVVFDKMLTRVREEADGTGSRQTTTRIRVLADAGVKQLAVLVFTYTASGQQVDIGYVRVIKPDGTVIATPEYNIQDLPADVTREAPMYSDIHQKHVAVRGLGVGDTLEYQVTLRTIKPDVPGQFWFDYTFEKNLITLDEQLDLDVPASLAVTVTSTDAQPTIVTAEGRKVYYWSSSNLARPDPDAPPKSVKKWKPSVQVTTFKSWEQVGAWYAALQKESLVVTPAIQARADKLTKGLTTDDEKIHAIFNDVALHIHYIALEFGIGRYQPHSAEDVLANEYGDCKDKHTLLAALLKAAGVEAWPVLISSSRYIDPDTPSPGQFDHVITLVYSGGKPLWMDSTAEVEPVGVIAAVLRNKQALAVPVAKPPYLEKTPADLPRPRSIHLKIEGTLSDQGLFTAKFDETVDSDVGALMRAAFRRVPQSQWKELVENIEHGSGYGGEVSNIQVSEIERIDEPLHLTFDYKREKYNQWNDKQTEHWIGPPMPPMGGELLPGSREKKPSDAPEMGGTGQTVYDTIVHLPAGWTMVPPKNADVVRQWGEFHASYRFLEDTFTAERRTQITGLTIPLDQWDDWISFRRALGDDWSTQVLIGPAKPKHHLW